MSTNNNGLAVVLGSVVAVSILFATPSASAEPRTIEVTANQSIRTVLEQLSGKSVALRLSSGEELSGVVEAIGSELVLLGQLTGKEFYSAVISLDEIAAVVYRAK